MVCCLDNRRRSPCLFVCAAPFMVVVAENVSIRQWVTSTEAQKSWIQHVSSRTHAYSGNACKQMTSYYAACHGSNLVKIKSYALIILAAAMMSHATGRLSAPCSNLLFPHLRLWRDVVSAEVATTHSKSSIAAHHHTRHCGTH